MFKTTKAAMILSLIIVGAFASGFAAYSAGCCDKPGPVCGKCGPRPPCVCQGHNNFCTPAARNCDSCAMQQTCGSCGAACGSRATRCLMISLGGCPKCASAPEATSVLRQGTVGVKIAPGKTGRNCITIAVWGMDSKLVAHPDVTVAIEGSNGSTEVDLQQKGSVLHGMFELPKDGAYRAIVTVRSPGVPAETTTFPIAVRSSVRNSASPCGLPCNSQCPGNCKAK